MLRIPDDEVARPQTVTTESGPPRSPSSPVPPRPAAEAPVVMPTRIITIGETSFEVRPRFGEADDTSAKGGVVPSDEGRVVAVPSAHAENPLEEVRPPASEDLIPIDSEPSEPAVSDFGPRSGEADGTSAKGGVVNSDEGAVVKRRDVHSSFRPRSGEADGTSDGTSAKGGVVNSDEGAVVKRGDVHSSFRPRSGEAGDVPSAGESVDGQEEAVEERMTPIAPVVEDRAVVAASDEDIAVDDDILTPRAPMVAIGTRPREAPTDSAPEISVDDLVAIEAAALSPPKAPAVGGPARHRFQSQPARPITEPPLVPAKTPLVIVPPHMGTLAPPQSTEGPASRRKGRLWWEELFNDDYLRTCERLTDEQLAREVDFIEDRLSVERGGAVMDLACGTGLHAIEFARRGYEVVGFDLSLAMLARAGEEAQGRETKLNFVQGDMREMTFVEQFDGIYCWNTSFGYFDEDKNAQVIDRIHRALKAGGLLLLDVANRDFLLQQSPSLAWFEGDGCVCMDEMTMDFITSRMKVKRTMMFDDGRSREIEYSMRVYGLHELGKILHEHRFKVCEVSGRTATPGVFFGSESPRTIILAEKRG